MPAEVPMHPEHPKKFCRLETGEIVHAARAKDTGYYDYFFAKVVDDTGMFLHEGDWLISNPDGTVTFSNDEAFRQGFVQIGE